MPFSSHPPRSFCHIILLPVVDDDGDILYVCLYAAHASVVAAAVAAVAAVVTVTWWLQSAAVAIMAVDSVGISSSSVLYNTVVVGAVLASQLVL